MYVYLYNTAAVIGRRSPMVRCPLQLWSLVTLHPTSFYDTYTNLRIPHPQPYNPNLDDESPTQILHLDDNAQDKQERNSYSIVVQRKTAVTAYLNSQQLLLFAFHIAMPRQTFQRRTAVTAYFSSSYTVFLSLHFILPCKGKHKTFA